jgi:hypothetical protein
MPWRSMPHRTTSRTPVHATTCHQGQRHRGVRHRGLLLTNMLRQSTRWPAISRKQATPLRHRRISALVTTRPCGPLLPIMPRLTRRRHTIRRHTTRRPHRRTSARAITRHRGPLKLKLITALQRNTAPSRMRNPRIPEPETVKADPKLLGSAFFFGPGRGIHQDLGFPVIACSVRLTESNGFDARVVQAEILGEIIADRGGAALG